MFIRLNRVAMFICLNCLVLLIRLHRHTLIILHSLSHLSHLVLHGGDLCLNVCFYICYYVVQLLLRCSDFCIYAVDVDETVNIIFRILKRVNHLLYLVIRVFHMYQIRRDYEQAGDPQNKKYDLGAAGQKEQDKEACGNSEYTLNTRLQLFYICCMGIVSECKHLGLYVRWLGAGCI